MTTSQIENAIKSCMEKAIEKPTNVVHVDFHGPLESHILRQFCSQFLGHLKQNGFESGDIEYALWELLIEHVRDWQNIPWEGPKPEIPAYVLDRKLLKALSGYFVEHFDAPVDEAGNVSLPYLDRETR